MKKKIVIIVAAVVVALAVLITGTILLSKSLFKDAEGSKGGDTVITVGEVSGKAGDTVKVPVKLSGNPGIMACMLEFDYDTESLKYVDYKKGDFLKDYEIAENDGKIRFISVEDADTDENGVILYLNFEVLEKAKTSEIKITIPENSICNYDEEVITATGVNGKVTVK